MESLEDKWRRFNIMDGEGHLVDGSSFTTYAFFKHYGVNFHTYLNDDDVCFHHMVEGRYIIKSRVIFKKNWLLLNWNNSLFNCDGVWL
jgi:hypothetical protein